ncbi:MAG: uroporphyrinogen decarboxylase family protein, partial [Patescibacteria group bacterium]
MTSRERIYKTIKGELTDRTPFSLWRNFPKTEKTAEGFANAVINFQKKFEFDLVKITPASGYFDEVFGAKFIYKNNKETSQKGTRQNVSYPIKNAKDWQKLSNLNVNKNILDRELKSLKLIRKGLGKDAPIVQTIPNPLTIAKELSGKNWIQYLRKNPNDLKIGLSVIAEIVLKFCENSLKSGADGIFFYTKTASYDFLTKEEYREFGMKYDYQILDELKKQTDLIILHIHGKNIMFDLLKDYPVQIINWHDRLTKPSLKQAKKLFNGALLGGINEWETLLKKTPTDVKKEIREAIQQTNGKRLIIG